MPLADDLIAIRELGEVGYNIDAKANLDLTDKDLLFIDTAGDSLS